jgi:hypothetical protein
MEASEEATDGETPGFHRSPSRDANQCTRYRGQRPFVVQRIDRGSGHENLVVITYGAITFWRCDDFSTRCFRRRMAV